MVLSSLTWVFVLSIITAFACAFGIGANDLANNFGSSVGTKALRMYQVVIIAGICEFLGAFFLGAAVVDTLKSGVANVSKFRTMPSVFMMGMWAVMLSAAIWDNLASVLGFPVSTTHTTVGAIVGFALVGGGGDAVIWSASKDSFPYYRGMSAIFSSWAVSPLLAGIAVSVLYLIMRTFILRSKHAFMRAFITLPLFVGATFGLISGFIAQTGGNNGTWKKPSDGKIAWISTVIAVGTALLTLIFVMPFLKKRALKDELMLRERVSKVLEERKMAGGPPIKPTTHHQPTPHGVDAIPAIPMAPPPEAPPQGGLTGSFKQALDEHTTPTDILRTPSDFNGKRPDLSPSIQNLPELREVDADVLARAMAEVDTARGELDVFATWWTKHIFNTRVGRVLFDNPVVRWLFSGMFSDLHAVVATDAHVASVWNNAEVFDYKTERLYRYLQIFSAMAMSFAHGSNDVANAIGPFSAVYSTWQTSAVPGSKSNVAEWQLALGGAGIVFGLAILGHHITQVLGIKAVKLTNARGFVCEICTAFVVVIASRFGLPISTTQTISGAILAIGLWEGRRGVNWWIALKIFVGWVLTLFIACGVSALFCALFFFSPNKPLVEAVYRSTTATDGETLAMLNRVRAVNPAGSPAYQSSLQLNRTLTSVLVPNRDPEATTRVNLQAFGLYNQSVCTVPTG